MVSLQASHKIDEHNTHGSRLTYESGATSKACSGSVGPISAFQPVTASSLVSTMNRVGPL